MIVAEVADMVFLADNLKDSRHKQKDDQSCKINTGWS